MDVSVLINGQSVRALLNTRAAQNFIFEDKAKLLGLKENKYRGTIKEKNSPARSFAGTARGVHVILGNEIGNFISR